MAAKPTSLSPRNVSSIVCVGMNTIFFEEFPTSSMEEGTSPPRAERRRSHDQSVGCTTPVTYSTGDAEREHSSGSDRGHRLARATDAGQSCPARSRAEARNVESHTMDELDWREPRSRCRCASAKESGERGAVSGGTASSPSSAGSTRDAASLLARWNNEPQFTMEEVARHNTRESCWLVVRGVVYDVTPALGSHPPGAGAILQGAGKDATEDFDFHSSKAQKAWKKYRIGRLRGERRCVIS